ncbi:MAG: hypothetical protein LBT80_03425 [Lactobacillaceae bacterium]|jgi:polyhydroxyalkanoate synthesis regulator phasin|nr:hypothetical protein [Lactobacillaceae bacterium]
MATKKKIKYLVAVEVGDKTMVYDSFETQDEAKAAVDELVGRNEFDHVLIINSKDKRFDKLMSDTKVIRKFFTQMLVSLFIIMFFGVTVLLKAPETTMALMTGAVILDFVWVWWSIKSMKNARD